MDSIIEEKENEVALVKAVDQDLVYKGLDLKSLLPEWKETKCFEQRGFEDIANQSLYRWVDNFTVSGSYLDYLARLSTTPKKVSTGISALDTVLGGGWSKGLTVLGGVPNAGKTTLLINSAIEMSKNGQNVVFLTYDMRGYELVDKVVSRISNDLFGEDGYTLNDLNNKVLLEHNDKNKKLIPKFRLETQRIHIVDMLQRERFHNELNEAPELEGMSELERIFAVYCATFSPRPVFMIDNLQQMAGFLGYEGKAGIDKTLRILKALSSKYGVAIVLISTIGRASYNKDIGLEAFKESGNIDFDMDYGLLLLPKIVTEKNKEEFDIDEFRSQPIRDITIKAVKGRDVGFGKVFITLNAPYCTFIPYVEGREIKDDNIKSAGKVKLDTDQLKFVD